MKKLTLASIAAVLLSSLWVLTPAVFAQDVLDPVCGGAGADAPVCSQRTVNNPLLGPDGIITTTIQIIIMVTTIACVITIIASGFRYVISSGDPNSVNGAKNAILFAIIGLVIALVGQVLVSFVIRRL